MVSESIWKYELSPDKKIVRLSMPKGARVLTAREQGETVCLWALVRPDAPKQDRTFEVVGTGWPLDSAQPRSYVGTAHLHGGALVFHVFELP